MTQRMTEIERKMAAARKQRSDAITASNRAWQKRAEADLAALEADWMTEWQKGR